MSTALTPIPAHQSLFDLEDQLQALLNCADTVTAEQEEEYRVAVIEAMTASLEKRNRVARFLQTLDSQAAACATEIKKLQERKKLFENTELRLRAYILRVIESLGLDAKGKPKKLVSDFATFSLRNKPEHVVITDESAVPNEYKLITATLPRHLWDRLCQEAVSADDIETINALKAASVKAKSCIDEGAIKAAIAAGAEVPGADIEMGESTLVVK